MTHDSAEAIALRREHPARSAAHIADILYARHGIRLSQLTVSDQLHKRGLDRARLTVEMHAFGRYEAERPNERWIGDVLVGPWVPYPRQADSRRARLFLLVDRGRSTSCFLAAQLTSLTCGDVFLGGDCTSTVSARVARSAGRRTCRDFVTEQGKAIPYGIYDIERNVGWVNVGQDHETAAFAVESLRRWWRGDGALAYPDADQLLKRFA